MMWPGLTQDVERLCSTCLVCQLTKRERKKYGLLPPKIAESDPCTPGHGLCRSSGSIYNNDTTQDTLSAGPHNK
jgi:Integrase zinc binding domain